jgi:hypothetical protein
VDVRDGIVQSPLNLNVDGRFRCTPEYIRDLNKHETSFEVSLVRVALIFWPSFQPSVLSLFFSLFSFKIPPQIKPLGSKLCLTSSQEARWRDYELIFSDGTKSFVAAECWRERPEPSLPYAKYMSCLRDAIDRYEGKLASPFGIRGAG